MSDGPWIKFYPSDWLTGTRGLSPAETGIYITLIAMMYEKGVSLTFDVETLARLCSCPAAPFRKVLDRLITSGKIDRDDTGLSNKRVKDELATRQKASIAASQSASQRWQKDKQNQPSGDANAMRETSSRSARQKSDTRYQKDSPTENGAEAREPTPKEILLGVLDEETADAVMKHRKAKRSPLSTPLAARGLVKAFEEYPGGPKAAAEMMVTNGWTGFKRDYWDSAPRGSPKTSAIEQRAQRLRERIENEHGIGRQGSGDTPNDERFPLLIEDQGRER